MKNHRFYQQLASLILLAIGTFSANASVPDNRHIVIVGSAQVQTSPDIAVISLELEHKDKKSITAKQNIDNRVNQLLDGLSKFMITEDNVSASSISTQPVYLYRNNQQTLDGFRASRTLKVTLNDITLLNDFLDFALTVGVNEIRNIQLKSSKELELKKEASALAVKDAKTKGHTLASAFDAKLGRIYSINSTSSSNYDRYGANQSIERITFSDNAVAKARPGKYLQENLVFTSSINVVFDLELN